MITTSYKLLNLLTKGFLGLTLIALAIFLGYKYSNQRVEQIKDNGSLTFGKITSVDEGGEAFDMSATYEYQVESKVYSRKVEIDHRDKQRHFEGCLWSTKDCVGNFAWVLFSRKEPRISLVNLSHIYSVSDTAGLIEPSNFDKFY